MAVIDQPLKGVEMHQNNHPQKKHHSKTDSLFRYAERLKFGDVHIKFDPKTGLRGIIAIHNLKLGPAIGGCRFITYDSAEAAIEDVLRLGYMMSYKAAISNLPHGGAKAVIMKPPVIKDRKALLHAFGDFVHELGGNYITAMDSGTNEADMDIIAERTPYVTCTSQSGAGGDPSPTTALGVRRGIEAAVKFKMGKSSLTDIHVAIQGAGHVGYYLAKELHELGAKITMCDVNPRALERCVEEFGVKVCSINDIYDVNVDVFAPCALGKVLDTDTIKRLNVSIVSGSANNQLAHHEHGTLLQERGILYVPDFVVNAGGLIYAAAMYDHGSFSQANQQVLDIYETVMLIFKQSKENNIATNLIAEQIAAEKLS